MADEETLRLVAVFGKETDHYFQFKLDSREITEKFRLYLPKGDEIPREVVIDLSHAREVCLNECRRRGSTRKRKIRL